MALPSACAIPCCFRLNVEGSAFWIIFRGHLAFTALRPGDSLTALQAALSLNFRDSISLLSINQATGLLTFTPVGFLLPLNSPAFAGRTTFVATYVAKRDGFLLEVL